MMPCTDYSVHLKASKLWCQHSQFPAVLSGYIPATTNQPLIDTSIIEMDYSRYYNIDKDKLRWKFVQLATTSLITDTVSGILILGWELFHGLTLGYFLPAPSDVKWIDRIQPSTLFLVHTLRIPFLIATLFVLSIYGIVHPQRARLYYVHCESLLYDFTADTFEICRGYRPLYHCMALALHKTVTVDSYDIYLQQRNIGYRFSNLHRLFHEMPDNDD